MMPILRIFATKFYLIPKSDLLINIKRQIFNNQTIYEAYVNPAATVADYLSASNLFPIRSTSIS